MGNESNDNSLMNKEKINQWKGNTEMIFNIPMSKFMFIWCIFTNTFRNWSLIFSVKIITGS